MGIPSWHPYKQQEISERILMEIKQQIFRSRDVNNKSLHWDLLHIQDKRNIRKYQKENQRKRLCSNLLQQRFKQQISPHWDLVEKKCWKHQKEYRGAAQTCCAFS